MKTIKTAPQRAGLSAEKLASRILVDLKNDPRALAAVVEVVAILAARSRRRVQK